MNFHKNNNFEYMNPELAMFRGLKFFIVTFKPKLNDLKRYAESISFKTKILYFKSYYCEFPRKQ